MQLEQDIEDEPPRIMLYLTQRSTYGLVPIAARRPSLRAEVEVDMIPVGSTLGEEATREVARTVKTFGPVEVEESGSSFAVGLGCYGSLDARAWKAIGSFVEI